MLKFMSDLLLDGIKPSISGDIWSDRGCSLMGVLGYGIDSNWVMREWLLAATPFGATPAGGAPAPAFGAAPTPFGAAPKPAFGASPSPFGATTPGAPATSLFGGAPGAATTSLFGAAPAAAPATTSLFGGMPPATAPGGLGMGGLAGGMGHAFNTICSCRSSPPLMTTCLSASF